MTGWSARVNGDNFVVGFRLIVPATTEGGAAPIFKQRNVLSHGFIVGYLQRGISMESYQILSAKFMKQEQVFLREVVWDIFLPVISAPLYNLVNMHEIMTTDKQLTKELTKGELKWAV